MYKLVVFTALLAVASAAPGYLGAHIAAPAYAAPAYAAPAYAAPAYAAPAYAAPAYAASIAPWGHGVVGAPLVSAPVVKTAVPVATSYANTVRIASPSVVAAHAPLVAAPAYAHGW